MAVEIKSGKKSRNLQYMNKLTKVILTIPSIIGVVFLVTFWSLDFLKWVSNNVVRIESQGPIVNGLIFLQIGYLIYRVWSYKNIEKRVKSEWTWLFLLFSIISAPAYIWMKDDELCEINKSVTTKSENQT